MNAESKAQRSDRGKGEKSGVKAHRRYRQQYRAENAYLVQVRKDA
ncbi:MAG: hypothetical protein G01um101429_577 [Parcubacteria group bacterium Gr01-1014_29]|nr:MAG: hypothetical protein G01um101429_577 [Parcubacteria group bacterium Gr01-1014_29]